MNKRILFLLIILFFLVAVVLFSLYFGAAGSFFNLDTAIKDFVLYNIRIPRIVAALTVGFGLACVGVVLQAVLQNSLADPFVLGSSSGAAVSVVLGYMLGFNSGLGGLLLGSIGAYLSVFIVLNIARSNGHYPSNKLVLAGIIVHSILSAVLMLLLVVSADFSSQILGWLMGGFFHKSSLQVFIVAIMVFVSFAMVQLFYREMNLISLGDEYAEASGLDIKKYKSILLILASIVTGAVVSLSGIIGFVGIAVPHVIRLVLGSNHKYLLGFSGLTGALFLLLADTIIRVYFYNYSIPIGVITILCGAPFFLFIMIKDNR